MTSIDPPTLSALAALISSMASLLSALRRPRTSVDGSHQVPCGSFPFRSRCKNRRSRKWQRRSTPPGSPS